MLVSGAMTMTRLLPTGASTWQQGVGEWLKDIPGFREATGAAQSIRFAGIAVAVLAVVGIAILLSRKK